MSVPKQNDVFKPIETDPVPRLALRLPEAALACGLSESFLHNMANVKVGRVRLFPVERLRRWLVEASEKPETNSQAAP